jgi:hypothetical protein
VTRRLIIDNDTGITVQLLSGTFSYSQPAREGLATFQGIQPGTYRVTTTAEFGFRQPEAVSILVDGDRSADVELTPVDDAIATEVFVDGQGSISKGGTIDVPAQGGINIRYRGKWQSVTTPFSDGGSLRLRASFDDVGELHTSETLALRPAEWERSLNGFVPCLGVVSAPIQCRTQASAVHVIVDRVVGSHMECHTGAGCFQVPDIVTIASRAVAWPVTFRLAPGCCTIR